MKKKNIGMELTIEGLGETLQVIGTGGKGTSLFIGNEYDTNKVSVYLEDLSHVQNKELVERLAELNKTVSEALTEIKEIAVDVYKTEWLVQGSLDEVEEELKSA